MSSTSPPPYLSTAPGLGNRFVSVASKFNTRGRAGPTGRSQVRRNWNSSYIARPLTSSGDADATSIPPLVPPPCECPPIAQVLTPGCRAVSTKAGRRDGES